MTIIGGLGLSTWYGSGGRGPYPDPVGWVIGSPTGTSSVNVRRVVPYYTRAGYQSHANSKESSVKC